MAHAQALREPLCLVSRCFSSPPRQPRSGVPRVAVDAPAKRQNTTVPASSASKLITALDALSLNSAAEVIALDEEIEVLRPGRVKRRSDEDGKLVNDKGKLRKQLNTAPEPTAKLHSIHPFFRPPTSNEPVSDEAPPVPKKTMRKDASKATGVRPSHSLAPVIGTNITKKKLTPLVLLPVYSYKDYTEHNPVMVFTQAEDEANDLVTSLKAGPIALDMEWRVLFRRQRNSTSAQVTDRRIAVVQVADMRGVILVVQVFGMERFPKNLQALIENPNIPKVGVNILNDGRKLFRDYGILAKNLVELGAVALIADPNVQTKRKIVSLAKLVGKYCMKTLQKGNERTGNWEGELDLAQLEYAANDVHSSLLVYQHLMDIARKRGVVLEDFAAEYTSNVKEDSVSRTSSQTTITTITESSQGNDVHTEHGGEHEMVDPLALVMRPQYLRAYRYWHERGMTLEKMCIELCLKGKAGGGLKASTVISYVINALQADSTLPFEMRKLRELVQMDGASWVRHREWLLSAWAEKKGLPDHE